MGRKEVKEYALYPHPWWDNYGSACVDPEYGISESFIKDKLKIAISFEKICNKFPPNKIRLFLSLDSRDDIFADTLSFVSQDGLIFYLFDEQKCTQIWQVYFDDYYRYPPNIKDARKESTSFKRWLINQI